MGIFEIWNNSLIMFKTDIMEICKNWIFWFVYRFSTGLPALHIYPLKNNYSHCKFHKERHFQRLFLLLKVSLKTAFCTTWHFKTNADVYKIFAALKIFGTLWNINPSLHLLEVSFTKFTFILDPDTYWLFSIPDTYWDFFFFKSDFYINSDFI